MKACALAVFIALGLLLGGCATATRGSNTNFLVSTTPPGARVSTSVPVQGYIQLSERQVARIKAGKAPVPHYTYRFCEPTPCGIKMPRKASFVALISKPGYIPRMVTIKSLTNKEIDRELAKKTAITAGATGAAAAGTAAAFASGFGASVSAGALVGGMAIVAAPVVGIGAIIHGIDSANGANRDLWPNPIAASLIKTDAHPYGPIMSEAITRAFEQKRREFILIPRKSYEAIQAEHEARLNARRERARKARKARQKARREHAVTSRLDTGKAGAGHHS